MVLRTVVCAICPTAEIEILDADHRLDRIGDAVVRDRGDVDRDVVAGDDLLRRNGKRDDLGVDLDQPIDAHRNDPGEPRLAHADDATQPKVDPELVLLDDANPARQERGRR